MPNSVILMSAAARLVVAVLIAAAIWGTIFWAIL
jgi:hypothetical protein